MKHNKKGFSLLEMMVVIAVIAILVSVIIPILSGSTLKARAATNAANLRSAEGLLTSRKLLGEITIDNLTNTYTFFGDNGIFAELDNTPAPFAEECPNVPEGTKMRVRFNNDGSATATYRGYGVEYFAKIAETGEVPEVGSYPMAEDDVLLNYTEDQFSQWRDQLSEMGESEKEIANLLLGFLTDYDSLEEMLDAAEKEAMDNNGQLDEGTAGIINNVLNHQCDHSGPGGLCSCGGNNLLGCARCGLTAGGGSGDNDDDDDNSGSDDNFC